MVFGWTTASTSDKFSVTGLEAGEHVVEVYHQSVSAQRGPLKVHRPYKTPKEWRKNSPAWKDVKEHFYALTNKRWLFVNYDDRKIIESYDLSQCDVLAGNDSITFMMGTERSFTVSADRAQNLYDPLEDNRKIVKMIEHLQSALPGRMGSQTASSQPPPTPQPSEDPLKVLKIRFAKGEISKEAFEEMKKMLA